MNRVVYSQAHVKHSRSCLHRAIFSLVALVLAGRVHIPPMPALDSDLVPFCSRGKSIEVVVAEYDCGYLGSASVCQRCLRLQITFVRFVMLSVVRIIFSNVFR